MPTYEYECPHCGHQFECVQSMKEDPLDACPECGKKPNRLISRNVGIAFKGSGFYITDSKTSGKDSKSSSK